MSQFKFGGFQGEIDTQDYLFQANIETHYKRLSEAIRNIPKNSPRSDYILTYCQSVFAFFCELFGKGTDTQMFGKQTNMRVCDDAVYALSLAIATDLAEYQNYAIGQNNAMKASLKMLANKPKKIVQTKTCQS